ncbi:hypothetical protein [Nonomuraea rubra]|uniref:hypothetical protein n=1 Tax=Nonomuraea rubra TaxID=46180 RepID=UPI0033C8CBEE
MAITTTSEHPPLFALGSDTAPSITGISYAAADPAVSDAALAGDGYDWLAAVLPVPRPPSCPACRHSMVLPSTAPVLWACLRCYPEEAR